MGLLTFSINVTLDGCVDHQEGIADDETHAYFTRLMDEGGAMLWGRVTYEESRQDTGNRFGSYRIATAPVPEPVHHQHSHDAGRRVDRQHLVVCEHQPEVTRDRAAVRGAASPTSGRYIRPDRLQRPIGNETAAELCSQGAIKLLSG
jgi:hypothetical protein